MRLRSKCHSLLLKLEVAVADVILSILLILGGILLLRRQALGFVSGLGLLFAASTLFIGLLIYFILQPFVSDVYFAWVDFLVVLVDELDLFCSLRFVHSVHLDILSHPDVEFLGGLQP